MKILHVSAECYPAAKVGGLGDVVGALPKYLCQAGVDTGVIIPKYHTKWILSHHFVPIYRGILRLNNDYLPFTIEQEATNKLGFPLFVVNIPGKFDRAGIYADANSGYGYGDEVERNVSFQIAVLKWIRHLPNRPKVLHCHDHHTGLIPFFLKYSIEYQDLSHIATVLTIHNGVYTGAFSWSKINLLPLFHERFGGMLEWANTICPLASAIKCAWKITTVSPTYLNELRQDSNGLEWLIRHESGKSHGILNGIDNDVWNPATDHYIAHKFNGDIGQFKWKNKRVVTERFRVNPNLPLVTFIGRLVGEKGADLIPGLIHRLLYTGHKIAFVILGTGDPWLMKKFEAMRHQYPGFFDAALEYNEGLAHQLYAGSDFLLMPSRVEPCGLNQMYAFRYGTVPIVRAVGGLRDTVFDFGEADGSGRGVRFMQFNENDAFHAMQRSMQLYYDEQKFSYTRHKIMNLDFSWQKSAGYYIYIYKQIANLDF